MILKRCYRKFRKLLKRVINKFYRTLLDHRKFHLSRNPRRVRRYKSGQAQYFAEISEKFPIVDHLVFFESFSALSLNDNPYALFKRMLQKPEFEGFQFVWAINSPEETARLRKRFPKVEFVVRNSDRYIERLATAKYVINNIIMPTYYAKRPGQAFVYTWHSITLKSLGYDIIGGKISIGGVISTLLMADYIISANSFMTKIFKDSYRLEHLYEGTLIEEGHPRNDLLINADRDEILKRFEEYGVKIDPNKKIILYAPTWKGASTLKPVMETDKYFKVREELLKNVDDTKYQVLIKPHQAVYKKLTEEERRCGVFIPATMDTNEILSVVDLLISDYSSIVFDYLLTDRPVLFYIPDIADYSDNRGIYFKPQELPGPATENLSEIIDWINHIDRYEMEYGECYRKFKATYCEHDDGNVSDRVINCIFGIGNEKYRTFKCNKTTKKKLVIYGGGLHGNGVTSTLKYRLDHIDYSRYDVTMVVRSTEGKTADTVQSFNNNIRMIVRPGGMSATYEERKLWNSRQLSAFPEHKIDDVLVPMFRREFMRTFGDSKFDYLIDYSGYTANYCGVFLTSPYGKKYVWQHADLYNDITDEKKMKQPSYRSRGLRLRSMISLYPQFHKIVSVGKACMERNLQMIGPEALKDRYTYVPNLISFEEVLSKKEQFQSVIKDGKAYYVDTTNEIAGENSTPNEALLPPENSINFVTMGRLSSEKNCINLLKAFEEVHKSHKNTTLTFIGSGDLKGELKRTIAEKGLSNCVILAGQLKNPFAYMTRFSCFVLASYNEGNPTVIPEARLLNLPIILARFSTYKDACLGETGQIITDHSPESLKNGMEEFIKNPQSISYCYDCVKANEHADEQFFKLFESEN